jgi:hypothetical protein
VPVLLALALVGIFAAPVAEGRHAVAIDCGASTYSYAGVQASRTGHGIAARLSAVAAPNVSDGHIGAWVGVGGTSAGPGGAAEWLQTGLAAFPGSQTMQMYYELTTPGNDPQYVELQSSVADGESHTFAVLEMAHVKSWWRVWVDGKPVSRPIYLPGSDGTWYPQAITENWNGGNGTCNAYSYQFSNVNLAQAKGGGWKPMPVGYEFKDPGYGVVPISSKPRTFLATSLNA